MRPQAIGQRDKGADVFGKMRNGAVGFAITDRRTIGPLRRNHQNRARAIGFFKCFIGAAGGVALQEAAFGVDPARFAQQIAQGAERRQTLRKNAMAGDRDVARLWRRDVGETKMNVETIQ